jgi:phage baseplate assembly protein W
MSEGPRKIEEAIRLVIATHLGERVMRSRFGSEVPALLFESATSATASRVADAIQRALAQWEPRIDVLQVLVEPDPAAPSHFIASMSYRIRENNSVLNLVYPLYLTEGAAEE